VLSMLQDVLDSLKGIETIIVSPTEDLKDILDYDFHFIRWK